MNNPEKLATYGTQDEEYKRKTLLSNILYYVTLIFTLRRQALNRTKEAEDDIETPGVETQSQN
jgi:hypothetical protein